MAKCAECGKAAKSFCVEKMMAFCPDCIGRIIVPGLAKTQNMTLEALDTTHGSVLWLTQIIMYSSMFIGSFVLLVKSGISDEYFKGASTCPALSVVRQGLARYDANVFYYFKPTLASYCDIEDSFWRLLMDGWVRGIVSGSDSILLLASTILKAYLFKSTVSVFLKPAYAMLYAILGLSLSFVITEIEDGSHWIYDHLPSVCQRKDPKSKGPAGGAPDEKKDAGDKKDTAETNDAAATTGTADKKDLAAGGLSISAVAQAKKWAGSAKTKVTSRSTYFAVLRSPAALYKKLTTKNKLFDELGKLFYALAGSCLLRLAVFYMGFEKLAAVGDHETVNVWRLFGEPALWFFLARQCSKVTSKLDKTLWKTVKTAAKAPLTCRREQRSKDFWEMIDYNKSRAKRKYDYYHDQAQDLLHILIDEIFNAVIAMRLFLIIFSAALPHVRTVLRLIPGIAAVIDAHRTWVLEATGFTDTDAGAQYLSDRFLFFGLSNARFVGGLVQKEVLEEAVEAIPHDFFEITWALTELVWRLLPTIGFYMLETKWASYLKQQKADWSKEWMGPDKDYKSGEWGNMMEKYGSFWNKVDRQDWIPPPAPKK